MNSATSRRWTAIWLAAIASFILVCGLGASTTDARVGVQVTQPPTETAVPLVTATSLPTSTPAALLAVNWNDVSAYKADMKPGFEGDVDRATNDNRYSIVARLSIETDAIIRGAERVRYTNRTPEPLTEIVFRLYPNTPALAGRMDVTHVSINNRVVAPSFAELDSVMSVPLDKPLLPGNAVEMTLDFSVVMTRELDASYGRFGYVHNVVSGTAWYPTLSVYDVGQGWWKAMPSPQGDPAYTETGLYDVRLTTPGDMTVVMSGTEIETIQNADGTITHHSVTGPMRDHAFQASTRYVIAPTEVDGTRINVVHYKDPDNPAIDGTNDAARYAAQAMKTYSAIYGEYPFKEFNVVENPTPTGVEFPGLVQIAERAWLKGSNSLEITIAHETAHQWFYSLVGNDQVDHPWLDEALATYTEFVYMRTYYPGAQAEGYVNAHQRFYTQFASKGQADLPVDLPVARYANGSYGVIVYDKGALLYVELERELGQETVYRALHEYFRRYAYGVVTSADVLHTFEDVTGKHLEDVFHKWIGDFPDDVPFDAIIV
jgi:hypothetical protein